MKRKVVGAVLMLMVVALSGGMASARGRTVTLPGGATMEMVWIEPGTFMMGSPEDELGRRDDEGPQHEVTITHGFWLGKYEVTRTQWQSVMEGEVDSSLENPDAATKLTWYDAQAFIAQLNLAERALAYRLPTEAEWEYACRAGTDTPWSFGDNMGYLATYAWYLDNCQALNEEYPHSVGMTFPNPWGLYDMYGNVEEFVLDCYDATYYEKSPDEDPQGPGQISEYYVLRGGSYRSSRASVRSAARNNTNGTYDYRWLGARILREQEDIITPVAPSTWGQVKSLLK